MTVHYVTIKNPYFRFIEQGIKTVEGRINSGMFRKLRPGDHIEFRNQQHKVMCKVVRVVEHSSFRTMLEKAGVKNCLPNCNSLEEGIRIYESLPGYAQRAKQYGVVAIYLEKRDTPLIQRASKGIEKKPVRTKTDTIKTHQKSLKTFTSVRK